MNKKVITIVIIIAILIIGCFFCFLFLNRDRSNRLDNNIKNEKGKS